MAKSRGAETELYAIAVTAIEVYNDARALFKRVSLPVHTLPTSDGLCVETPHQWTVAKGHVDHLIRLFESMNDPLWIMERVAHSIEQVLGGEYDEREKNLLLWAQRAPETHTTIVELLKELLSIAGADIACQPNYVKKVAVPQSAGKISYALHEAHQFVRTAAHNALELRELRKRARLA